jgi:hypothetical protein
MNTIEGDNAEPKINLSKSESSIELFGYDELLKSNTDELKIAATVLLAMLCKNCPPSSLLGSSQDKQEPDSGVLKMLGLVINSAAVHVEEARMTNAKDEGSEEIFSTASIVLSLLIALLELGAEKRSDYDESFFKTILPSLRVLSSGCVERGGLEATQGFTMVPELAEMESHAMALIVARDKTDDMDDIQKPPVTIGQSRLEAVVDKLSKAECDLQSTQPPLRAKGVISLRHIARSLVTPDSSLVEHYPTKT